MTAAAVRFDSITWATCCRTSAIKKTETRSRQAVWCIIHLLSSECGARRDLYDRHYDGGYASSREVAQTYRMTTCNRILCVWCYICHVSSVTRIRSRDSGYTYTEFNAEEG